MIEREEAEERRSDGGLSILTKHEDIRTAPVTAEEASDGSPADRPSLTTREAEESVVSNPPRPSFSDEACLKTFPQEASSPAGTGSELLADREGRSNGEAVSAGLPTNSEKATVATQGEATAPTSAEREDRAAANAGGDDVDRSAARATTSNTGEGAANTALPATAEFLEDVPPMPMKRLGYAHCFPDLTKADYGRLEFSIAGIGVNNPIIRMGDVIVDGWARYNIARTLGISYPIKNYSGNDVLLDVIEWQRASRNFTPAQEKKIAADLAKQLPHRADEIMAAFGLAEALEAAE